MIASQPATARLGPAEEEQAVNLATTGLGLETELENPLLSATTPSIAVGGGLVAVGMGLSFAAIAEGIEALSAQVPNELRESALEMAA